MHTNPTLSGLMVNGMLQTLTGIALSFWHGSIMRGSYVINTQSLVISLLLFCL